MIGYLVSQEFPLQAVEVLEKEPQVLIKMPDGKSAFVDKAAIRYTLVEARTALLKIMETKLRYQEADLVKTQQLISLLKEE